MRQGGALVLRRRQGLGASGSGSGGYCTGSLAQSPVQPCVPHCLLLAIAEHVEDARSYLAGDFFCAWRLAARFSCAREPVHSLSRVGTPPNGITWPES